MIEQCNTCKHYRSLVNDPLVDATIRKVAFYCRRHDIICCENTSCSRGYVPKEEESKVIS